MDPVSLVLAALATGASAGVSDTVKAAVSDAYHGLKSLVRTAFLGDKRAVSALTMFEDDPTEKVLVGKLADQLTAHRVQDDPQIMAAARTVLDAAGPTATAPGSVAATVLQIEADRGGVAAATNPGTIFAGYTERSREAGDPS